MYIKKQPTRLLVPLFVRDTVCRVGSICYSTVSVRYFMNCSMALFSSTIFCLSFSRTASVMHSVIWS